MSRITKTNRSPRSAKHKKRSRTASLDALLPKSPCSEDAYLHLPRSDLFLDDSADIPIRYLLGGCCTICVEFRPYITETQFVRKPSSDLFEEDVLYVLKPMANEAVQNEFDNFAEDSSIEQLNRAFSHMTANFKNRNGMAQLVARFRDMELDALAM